MKSIILTVLLLTINLTASYAQIGDSLTCYTNQELERIANRVVYANECDTLLRISEAQHFQKDLIIEGLTNESCLKDSIITAKDEVNNLKEDIIQGKDNEIQNLHDALIKEDKRLKITKLGWLSTTIVLIGLLSFSIIG